MIKKGLVVARVLKISGRGLKIISGKTLGMVRNFKKFKPC
jgi:hypothetical protein